MLACCIGWLAVGVGCPIRGRRRSNEMSGLGDGCVLGVTCDVGWVDDGLGEKRMLVLGLEKSWICNGEWVGGTMSRHEQEVISRPLKNTTTA